MSEHMVAQIIFISMLEAGMGLGALIMCAGNWKAALSCLALLHVVGVLCTIFGWAATH